MEIVLLALVLGLGVLALAPLAAYLQRRERGGSLSPERRLLLTTTYCELCRERVPFLETVESPTLGRVCRRHVYVGQGQ